MPYDELASYYDRLNYDIDYNEWADYIDRIISHYHPGKNLSVLDFACGTGTITTILQDYDYDICGLDKSESMIRIARQKNTNIVFNVNDIAHFEPSKKFDVIISTFDSINAITNERELMLTFENIYRLLKTNGILIFDINTENGFKAIGDQFTYTKDKSGIFSVWTLEYNDRNKTAKLFLTVFERITGANYTRNDFVLDERIYSLKELKSHLTNVGFKNIHILDHLSLKPHKNNSFRVDFIAIKKE